VGRTVTGKHEAAGVPPFIRFETITPEGVSEDTQTTRIESGDPLHTDVHHLPTAGLHVPIAEAAHQVAPETTLPAVGKGSANRRPQSRLVESQAYRAAQKARRRARRGMAVWRVIFGAGVAFCVAGALGLGFLAWANGNDSTPVPLRNMTPLYTLAAVLCGLVALLLVLAWPTSGGRR
jgi:hypothetical protein